MAFFEKNKNKSQSYKLGEEIGTGKIIAIKDAQNGLKCNCICSDCKAPFEAIQGQKNEWHFRHYQNSECKGGQETALHLLSKEIICRNSKINISKIGAVQYSNPISEQIQGDFIPDITAQFGEEKLYFEVVVSNVVSRDKANFYKTQEIKSISIDLSRYQFESEEQLEKDIIETFRYNKVIFWEKNKLPNFNLSSIQKFILYSFIGYLLYKAIKYFTKSK